MLPEDDRRQRVIKLSSLYIQEMGMDVTTVKKWLIEVGQPITNLDETMDDEYLNALRNVQQANGLGDDGIFGYRTLNLLSQLRDRPDNNKA